MKNKSVQSGFSMIFIFIGLEFSIPIFMGLLANQNGSSADSALLISAYWTFLFIGRVISIRLQSIFTPKHMIIGSATLSISLILLLQILTTQNSMWLTSLGLLNACMYPSIFSHHTKKLDESLHYVASGVLLMGLSGGAIIPLAQALAAEYVGIHMSFSVIIACYIYLIWMLQPAVAHRSISTHNSYHEAT